MQKTKTGKLGRRDFLKATGAIAGAAAVGAAPRSLLAQTIQPTEIIFASAPFFDKRSIESLLARYNDAQSSVHATYLELPSAADGQTLHRDLRKRLESDKSPDIFCQDIVWIAELAAAGLSLPLNDFFSNDDMAAFFPGIVQGCTVDGALAAMPWFADSGMLFYRADILEKIGAEVPETWDDLVITAMEGMAAEPEYGFVWQGKKSEALVCNVVSAIGSNGGTILRPDGTVAIAEPEAVAAVQFLYDTINHLLISPADVLTWDEEPARKQFNAGNALFLRNWSYTWGLAQQSGSPVAGKIGVAPLPHFPGKSSAACLGGYQFGVSASSKKSEAAIDLLRWLSSPEAQLHFAVENGLAPTRQSVFENPLLAEAQPFLAQLKDVFVGALARPVTAKYPEVTLVIQAQVEKALASGEISSALTAAKEEIEAILAG